MSEGLTVKLLSVYGAANEGGGRSPAALEIAVRRRSRLFEANVRSTILLF